MEEKRLFLLDAYALIFRAYYALIRAPRVTRSGFNASAVFGFINTLEELLRRERPTHMAVCFDPQGPTFRHEAYEAYKGEREATPEDIRLSVPVIKDIIAAYRIPAVEVEGFEADDVIGTLAVQACRKGFTTYMMTPDKDFGQLVAPRVLQYKPSYRGQDFELRGEEEVCARYGIESPRQVIDLLALMGDKSDNIPGCPGVGEKTAVKLIAEFGSVDGLLAHTGRLKGALRRKVEENAAQIEFSKFLATIRTDVPLDIDPDGLVRREPDRERLFALFDEMEFRQLADRVRRRLDAGSGAPAAAAAQQGPVQGTLFGFGEQTAAPAAAPAADCDWSVADSDAALDALASELAAAGECGLCVLTAGESDFDSVWLGAAVAAAPGRAVFIPRASERGEAMLLDLMARPDITKVTAQAKRDYVTASRRRTDGAPALVSYYDVSLAHYLLQPEMRHDVGELAAAWLGVQAPEMPEALASRAKARQLTLTTAEAAGYACRMADLTLRLRAPLDAEIDRQGMRRLLCDVELPLVRVLAGMELAGVRVDVPALSMAAEGMELKIRELEREIHSLAGVEFNVSSPAKVGEVLFDRLGLDDKARKTRKGQYSTSEDVLEKIAHKNPIVGKILQYRQLRKLLSTYLTALPAAIDPSTGKIHTTYNQTVTATGRISSSAPNLQNIPVRDEVGRDIRRAFIPDEGHLFLSADYSQIELRLVADFAGDDTMLDAFAHGRDIHAITAARIYHRDSPDDVTPTERRHAKTANFGILYGISAFGLASRLGIPRGEAKELIDSYFATFPSIRRYMDGTVERARADGYVSTRLGRKRMLPDINSRNPVVRGYAERNAINAPVQGSAADIIKVAMVRIADEMERRGMRSRMIMQVHDELNFDVVPGELDALRELVCRLMEGAYEGRVRLTAEVGVGANWLEAH